MFQLRAGQSVKFVDDDEVLDGTVNGEPYVLVAPTDGDIALIVRVPVHVPETNDNIDVHGENIVHVEPPESFDHPPAA